MMVPESEIGTGRLNARLNTILPDSLLDANFICFDPSDSRLSPRWPRFSASFQSSPHRCNVDRSTDGTLRMPDKVSDGISKRLRKRSSHLIAVGEGRVSRC